MITLDELQTEIAEWSDKQFGSGCRARLKPCIAHLKKEVYELYNSPDNEEFADCLMLLLDAARLWGMNGEDLMSETKQKLEINKTREWGQPDIRGVIEHKRDKEYTVYLAGPMLDCDTQETNNWREKAKEELNFKTLNPCRRIIGEQEQSAAIVEPDKEDIFKSDIILANCWKPSAGTSMEIYMGWELNKIVISIVPVELSCSAWIFYHSSAVVCHIDTAIKAINDNCGDKHV